jgi:hypothetical protein
MYYSFALGVAELTSERVDMESLGNSKAPVFSLIEKLVRINIGLSVSNYLKKLFLAMIQFTQNLILSRRFLDEGDSICILN